MHKTPIPPGVRVGTGAFIAMAPHAPEIVARRIILRNASGEPAGRVAAAEWLRANGTAPDRAEAAAFLRSTRHA